MMQRALIALVGLAAGGFLLYRGAEGWVLVLAIALMVTGVLGALVGPHRSG